MDAAHTLLKKTALFSALALFGIAPGLQAQPTFNAIGTVTLTLGGGQVTIGGSGDPATPITFNATLGSFSVPSGDPQIWVHFPGTATTTTTSGTTSTASATLAFVVGSLGAYQGTYSATVTLHATTPATGVVDSTFTVTYTSGSGGGGGQSGAITAFPTSIPLSASPGSGTLATANITLSTLSASAVPFTISYTPLGSWLQASTAYTSVVAGSNAFVNVSASAFSLPTNTYSGTVTITPTGGGTPTQVQITFTVGTGGTGTITSNINPVSLSYTTGGSFPSQFVTLTSTTGATNYTATASSSNSWLLVNSNLTTTAAYTSGLTISAGSNVTLLGTQGWSGTITLSDVNGGTGSITVSLTVNGGTSTITISPNPVTMSAPIGYSSGQVPVTLTTNVGGALSVAPQNAPWLSVLSAPSSVSSGSTTIYISASAAGYTTNQTLLGSLLIDIGSQQASVQVTFIIGTGSGGGGGSNGLSVAPTSLNFYYQTGTSRQAVAQQVIGITGTPGARWTSSTAVNNPTNGTWLNLSTILANLQQDGTSSTTVQIDPNGLAAGTYTGSVSINISGVIQSVSVTLVVTASPVLLPSPGAVLVNYHTGDAAPGPVAIALTASDASSIMPVASTTTSWITVTQTAGSTAFSVTVNPTSQAQGMLSGTVTVTQAGLANSPLIIPVTLINNGGASSGNGQLTLNPASLTFNAAVNGSSPAAQSISVTANNQTSFTVGASTQNGGNWLSVSQSGGVTPATITIFVTSTSLPLGNYSGTITFTANGTNQTVSVALNVTTTGGGGGNITSDKTSLSFSAQLGATNPATQTINISGVGSAAVGVLVSRTTSNGVNWLSTGGVTSGTTPLAIPVSVDITNLAAATYTGSILVSPVGSGTPVTISVSLVVTAPTVSASPTSLTFNYRAGDPAPASKTISVTGGTGLTFTATATSSGGWLGVSPAAGFTPGTVTVSVTPTGLNSSTTPYTGTITVAGSGTALGTTTISVSLTVTAPLPTVSKLTNAAASFLTATTISPGEIVSLFASDAQHPIGPSTPVGLTLDSTGKVATTIGGVQVLAGGFACPMIYASATQINAVVPYELSLFTNQRVDVFVKYLGQSSNAVSLNVATTQPGLFTQNGSGTGPAAILNSNGSVNSPSNPAAKGDIVVIYMTGEGQTAPPGITGKVTTVGLAPQFTPAPLLQVSILIGPSGSQQAANYIYAGEAPGFVSGVMQLNVVLPTTISSGDQQIMVSVGSNSSQSGATVSVR